MEFEWDDRKASANLLKHGVSFDEAATAFINPLRIDYDDFHSTSEDRYIAIGISDRRRRLFVSHVYRNGKIRIIMARIMSPREWNQYGQGNA